jgi:hypothetical protein
VIARSSSIDKPTKGSADVLLGWHTLLLVIPKLTNVAVVEPEVLCQENDERVRVVDTSSELCLRPNVVYANGESPLPTTDDRIAMLVRASIS